jgi:hypothetical protein
MSKIISIFTALMVCFAVCFTPSLVTAAEPHASADVGAFNKYVFRGEERSDSNVVVQPELGVGYGPFSVSAWGNLDSGSQWSMKDESQDWTFNEFRATAALGHDFGIVKTGVGVTNYTFRDSNVWGLEDTSEVFGLLGLDVILNPTFTAFRDVDEYDTWYLVLGVSHSFQVAESATLDLGVTGSYVYDEDDKYYGYNDFHDGVASAGFTFDIGEHFKFKPEVAYVFPLSSDAEDFMKAKSFKGDDSSFVTAGATFSLAF